MKHISVLLKESINALNIKENGIYVDMTLGYAGHAKEILKMIPRGFLYAFDKDMEAIEHSTKELKTIGSNFKIFHDSFANIKEILEKENISEVDGILFDLGVSSPEIDDAQRGFSYMKDSNLDMRMNKDDTLTAFEIINNYSLEDLTRIMRVYGEEKHAMKIAKNIIASREAKPITGTLELVSIISNSIPYKDKRDGHPAKRVFQALRIEVNNELDDLLIALRSALKMLRVGGIIAVISFHSLEDRIVKQIFREVSEIDPVVKGLPNINSNFLPDYELVTKKPILPTAREVEFNKRSTSSKLRVIKRIK